MEASIKLADISKWLTGKQIVPYQKSIQHHLVMYSYGITLYFPLYKTLSVELNIVFYCAQIMQT